MPRPNLFDPANFDPARVAPNDAVIFDDSGYLSDGGIGDPQALGYTQAYLDAWLESEFAWAGLSWLVWDVDTQFPDATYFYAMNSAVTTPQGTTHYADHGFQGGAGSEVIIDASGDNVVASGGGADLILLGTGANFVDAGAGDDVVITGAAQDVVALGSGNDWLWAGAGDDTVRAGSGDDTVLGREGADTIAGGAGRDRIDGGADNDLLFGGDDGDVFVFGAGSGSDVIRDFQTGLDVIEIDSATGIGSFNDVLAAASRAGRSTLIELGNGDEILLHGVRMQDLSAADFDFV